MMINVTAHWRPRPARGELKGRFEAKNLAKGRTPSRPSSWLTRPWEKRTERTFPMAERAMMTEMAVLARGPNLKTREGKCQHRIEEQSEKREDKHGTEEVRSDETVASNDLGLRQRGEEGDVHAERMEGRTVSLGSLVADGS
jgi:hypothetical protein